MNSRQKKSLSKKLIIRSRRGDLDQVQKLIEDGADVNYKEKFGLPALIWATKNGHARVIALLLENGADPNTFDSSGETALNIAESQDIIDILKEGGAVV